MIFDDIPNIFNNSWIHIKDLSLASINQALHAGISSELGRPIAMLSFALNFRLDGLNPYYFKLVNLAIHLINGLLVFTILNGLLQTPAISTQETPQRPSILKHLPWIIAISWLVNPINVTPVLYIVQRMTELAALFTFLGISSYIYLRLKLITSSCEKKSRQIAIASFLSTLVFTVLATLSKETGALLPLYLLMIEWIFFKFHFSKKSDRARYLGIHALFVGLPAGLITYIFLFHFHEISAGYQQRGFTLEQRLLTEPRVIGSYLKMMIVPVASDFGLFHDDFNLSESFLSPISTLAWIVILSIMFISALWIVRKLPLAAFGILFFLASHSIESTLLSLEIMHEHRNYPGSFGIMTALFGTLLNHRIWQQTWSLHVSASIILIILFAAVTHTRAQLWSNQTSLILGTHKNHPDSLRSNRVAAELYLSYYNRDPIRYADLLNKARQHYLSSLITKPDDPHSIGGLILLRRFSKEPVSEADIIKLKTAITLHAHQASIISLLRRFLDCRTQLDCPISHNQITQIFQAALNNTSITDTQRSHVLSLAAQYALTVLGNIPIAVQHQKMALVHAPKEPRHWLRLIHIYIASKNFKQAQEILNEYKKMAVASHTQPIIARIQEQIIQHSSKPK